MATVADRILERLTKVPAGLDDGQLAEVLEVRRQTVNQVCRRLSDNGRLHRAPGPNGRIVNRLLPQHDAYPRLPKDQPTADAGVAVTVGPTAFEPEPAEPEPAEPEPTPVLRAQTVDDGSEGAAVPSSELVAVAGAAEPTVGGHVPTAPASDARADTDVVATAAVSSQPTPPVPDVRPVAEATSSAGPRTAPCGGTGVDDGSSSPIPDTVEAEPPTGVPSSVAGDGSPGDVAADEDPADDSHSVPTSSHARDGQAPTPREEPSPAPRRWWQRLRVRG